MSVRELAHRLPAKAYRTIAWREGTHGAMRSRFARCRVRPAHRDEWRSVPHDEEWLVIEWPKSEQEPTRYWLSTVPPAAEAAELIALIKLRWRIERDFQEMKDELGLDHFEGRGWRGFHHRGILCIAAYAFLAAERARLSPQSLWASCAPLRYPKVSARGVLPLRAQRHQPTSITTQRLHRARSLIALLPACPWCGNLHHRNFMTQ